MKFLQIQIESREESSRSRCLRKSSPVAQERRHPRLQPPVPSALALAAGSANNSHACCVLCGHRDHTVKDCQTIMSADEIRRRLIEKNCCFRCAREGHVARKCRNAAWLKCKHCANHHLTALCAIWKPYNHPNADRSDTTKKPTACQSLPVLPQAVLRRHLQLFSCKRPQYGHREGTIPCWFVYCLTPAAKEHL